VDYKQWNFGILGITQERGNSTKGPRRIVNIDWGQSLWRSGDVLEIYHEAERSVKFEEGWKNWVN